jgi:hypothetical protein
MSCDAEAPLDSFAKTLAEQRHSRRMVFQIGLGALAATMFPSLAHAGRQCRNKCLRSYPCGRPGPRNSCGTSPEGNNCVCGRKFENEPAGCACFNPVCTDTPCSSSSDCAEGFACVVEDCCGGTVCAPRCRKSGDGRRMWM